MSAQARLSKLVSWEELYQAALVETNREKLTGLVGELETAIVGRWHELSDSEENDKEWAAIVLAAQQLLNIKTDKLGWPALKPHFGRREQSSVIDKVRRVESIHHWHR
jgi:hypothetical protein